MKLSKIIIVLIGLAIVGIGFYSLSSGSNEEEYKSAILKERQEKDEFMMNSEESPFVNVVGPDGKRSFSGLQYFAPDPKYRVRVTLEEIENKNVIILPTSTGEENRYLQYAWAEFDLDGARVKLLLLEVMAMGPSRGTLFLAFADETSGNETYGAGRYLELKKIAGSSSMTLDFNKSYNPYCAYIDDYSCPFPPKENILKVSIRAGEKVYH